MWFLCPIILYCDDINPFCRTFGKATTLNHCEDEVNADAAPQLQDTLLIQENNGTLLTLIPILKPRLLCN